jgi:protein phosphatase
VKDRNAELETRGTSVHILAKTDIGLVRKRNEDFFVLAPEHHLIVLCDGMGGHPGGDLASRMTAEEVQRSVATTGGDKPGGNIEQFPLLMPFVGLIRGVFRADQELRAYGRRNPQFQGMGTTVAAIQEHAGVVCAVHVGDSRIYRLHDRKFAQITKDHSVVETLPESARASFAGMRNILTRAVGVGEDLEVDFTLLAATAGDVYLLCSDGLHNFVSEERIREVLASHRDRAECLQTLVDDANRGGGGDNITLAIAWIEGTTPSKSPDLQGAIWGDGVTLHVQLQA